MHVLYTCVMIDQLQRISCERCNLACICAWCVHVLYMHEMIRESIMVGDTTLRVFVLMCVCLGLCICACDERTIICG